MIGEGQKKNQGNSSPAARPQRVSVVGVGLMGGSLGLALMRQKGRWRVTGVGRRFSRLKKAKERGSVHEITTDFKKGVQGASVVVLAAPVGEIVPLAKRLRPFLPSQCLVMDVGSVKAPIVRELEKIFSSPSGPHFVGVHPMTGSEKTGVENARGDLYEGAACVITPGKRTSSRALQKAGAFWRGVGGRVLRLSPDEHDRWMAMISHLPHLLADSLVLSAALWEKRAPLLKFLAAGSFRDMTRVAGADPSQWSSIFRFNAVPVRKAARCFQKILQGLLDRGCSRTDLRRAKRLHDRFLQETGKRV